MFKSKKAAGEVVSSLIIFIAVLGLATAAALVFKSSSDKSTTAMYDKQESLTDIIDTDFKIETVYYEDSGDPDYTFAYIKNTGKKKHNVSKIDIYIDGLRIPRNETNRTIAVESDTDTVDVGIWNTKEIIKVSVNMTIDGSISHEFALLTDNGVKKTEDY